MTTTALKTQVDAADLEVRVKDMYRSVARDPHGDFHFEMGRVMAERLGYPAADLDRIPPQAIESFAGVGYYFHLADIKPGERVVDLGSGSGLDAFFAALRVGDNGSVVGIDMTDAQLQKADALRDAAGVTNTSFHKGYIQAVPAQDESFDAVISNGVINLSPDKSKVFREAARLLRPGGRLALSDIVTGIQLPDNIVCDATLWAACIGGAMQQDNYVREIQAAGLQVVRVEDNPQYRFISDSARWATDTYQVKSVSILASKPA